MRGVEEIKNEILKEFDVFGIYTIVDTYVFLSERCKRAICNNTPCDKCLIHKLMERIRNMKRDERWRELFDELFYVIKFNS